MACEAVRVKRRTQKACGRYSRFPGPQDDTCAGSERLDSPDTCRQGWSQALDRGCSPGCDPDFLVVLRKQTANVCADPRRESYSAM